MATDTRFAPNSPIVLGAFVFLGGFTMMAFEIMAARLVSPFLGSSLQTWTAVIASVLLGIVVGSRLGGSLADRFHHARLLGVLLVLSGLLAAASYAVAFAIGPMISASTLPLPLLALTFGVLVFFPPAALSASITPVAVRVGLDSLEHTGRVYGMLGAWNSAGSILGTYLTGFVFQAYLSTRMVWFALAISLAILGCLYLLRIRRV
ncbi:fused MFS/spermidine synthase [Candidatus Uhrbacteria bacterium]|nr:fused MFS/spermidine synthase [Candidatus Uhrbacteria bacterium]